MADVIELKITVEGGQEPQSVEQVATNGFASKQSLPQEADATPWKSGAKMLFGLFMVKTAIDVTKQVGDFYVSTIATRTGNSLQQAKTEVALEKLGAIKDVFTGEIFSKGIGAVQNAVMYELNRKATNEVAYNMRVRAGYTANGNR